MTIKGHAQKRAAEYRRLNRRNPIQTGEANLSGWEQLAALTEQAGLPIQHGGERLVN